MLGRSCTAEDVVARLPESNQLAKLMADAARGLVQDAVESGKSLHAVASGTLGGKRVRVALAEDLPAVKCQNIA